jgi:hypothetical protein
MRKFHSIAALCGDGLRPELQALFDRLAIDRQSELFVRKDGMVQSGPDLLSEQHHRSPGHQVDGGSLAEILLGRSTTR